MTDDPEQGGQQAASAEWTPALPPAEAPEANFAPGLDAVGEQGAAGASEEQARSWGDLSQRLGNVLSAEQSGGQAGSLAGTPANVEPVGLPQLERIASIAEQLESVLSSPPQAAYNPVAGPERALRPEEGLPGPTSLPGYPNMGASWHGGAPWGMDAEATPLTNQLEPPAYEGGFAGELPAAEPLTLPEPVAAPEPQDMGPTAVPGSASAPAGNAGGGFAAVAPPAYASGLTGSRGQVEPLAMGGGFPGGEAGAVTTGGFPGGEPPQYAAGGLGGMPQAPPVDYPAMAGGGEQATTMPQGGGQGGEGQGGVLESLARSIEELKATIAGMGEKRGPKERRPGPQADGSFVPGGPGMLGSSRIFGDFPRESQ